MQLPQKFMVTGGCMITFTGILGFALFDQILRFGIRDQTALRRRNELRGIYLKLPFPLDFRVYFFNVSNPMEVQKGEIPDLQEVGPYCYDEFIEKIDVVDNIAEDSLTYSPYHVFKFNQEKSGLQKDDDVVTIIHPLVVRVPVTLLCDFDTHREVLDAVNGLARGGMVIQVTKTSPALLSIVNKAIAMIFPNLHSIYLTAKVKDILFDGVEIDCRVTEFPGKAICSQLKTQIPGLKMSTEKDVFLFSLLGPRNATEGKPVKVKRGISRSKDLGRVLEIDGKKQLDLWATPECNTFQGTDGWIFPPLLDESEEVRAFSSDLCRLKDKSVNAKFIKKTVMKGVHVFRYEADLGDMEHNPEEKCYCPTPKTCLKKGVLDLTKCMGVPIYATLPHFLKTDEMYSQQVHGMNPVFEDHIVKMHFEPMTSAPIEAKKRMQFNLPIAPNSKIDLMKTIPEALHPIFWIEEGVELEGALFKKVTTIFLVIKIVKIVRWLSIVIGLMCFLYGVYLHYKNKNSLKITPTHNVDQNPKRLGTNRSLSTTKSKEDSNETHKNPVLSGHEFDKY